MYRYDGKTLVNFTTKDGLDNNRIGGIQEDKAGNIYFTTSVCDGDRRYEQAQQVRWQGIQHVDRRGK